MQAGEAIAGIAKGGRFEWKKCIGDHRRSLVENLMYRLNTLTGDPLSSYNLLLAYCTTRNSACT